MIKRSEVVCIGDDLEGRATKRIFFGTDFNIVQLMNLE